jgi:hypothetical protein
MSVDRLLPLQTAGACADYVGRILKGTKTADLPVLRPTKFDLAITSGPQRRSALQCDLRCSRVLTR